MCARSALPTGSAIELSACRLLSIDDVLSAFGHTRESLAALPDDAE
jgi:hypothetical protein